MALITLMRMKTRIFFGLIVAMAISATVAWGRAQVSIPDPGLEAAIRESIQKPTGPLTELDLLSVDVLSACCRDIKTLEGLEQARNVRVLDLHSNSLTNGAVVNALTNLQVIDFFQNQLSSFVLTNGSKLTILDIAFNSLTECPLPSGLA